MKRKSKPCHLLRITLLSLALIGSAGQFQSLIAEPPSVSGVYPALTMRNDENECGTGAIVIWGGDLWAITYAPHKPAGSSDKLYRVTPDLQQIIFDGSVGGTPANRMIHRESNQLLIGPYLIDAQKQIRVLPPTKLYGRLTGNARHLSDATNKVYYATMEEGLYEVDVNTLEVTCLIRDGNGGGPDQGVTSELPGYHGKGLYSSQGRLVYANNGDRDPKVKVDPTVASGALAEWFGEGDWQLVRRNQFTEVTGPGGISGNENPGSDPLWAMGWDARSVILALLENEQWHYYRLPKGSHSYDGAHGWNTEWPRIREIGEQDFLATMHGTFWRFPPTFSLGNSAGIQPRSNYLKVIGDFCRWNDRVVFGCDDSARSEFLNTRTFKAERGAAGQSNSNLWFVEPERIDEIGPVIGRGSVWLRDEVKAGEASDPYLFSGYDHRQLHLTHGSDSPVSFVLEVDRQGNNQWELLGQITVPAKSAISRQFTDESGVWIRLKSEQDAREVTAHFQYRNRDPRSEQNDKMFAGIASPESPAITTGVMRSLSFDKLGLAATTSKSRDELRYYEINQQLELVLVDDPAAAIGLTETVRQPENSVTVDEASVLMIEDGQRYRFPKNSDYEPADTESGGEQKDTTKTLVDFMDQSLARSATVTVSSTHLGYEAKHAVDGDIDDDEARWVSGGGGRGWIELDFGGEKKISSLWLISGWKKEVAYVAKSFDVQIWNAESEEWQTVAGGEVRDNAEIEREVRLAKPVTAGKLRVIADNTNYFRLYEVGVFSEVLDIPPPAFRGFGPARVCREVATERDLLNVHGTFYELPARNAQGLAKMRPIATHHLAIQDFCSHNGLLFLTGIDAESQSEHIFRSADGNAAVWAGVVDDLWKLGKPRGIGGPWKNTAVAAGEPSDPYLMTAYDKKSLTLSSSSATTIAAEIDVDGTGLWVPWKTWQLEAGAEIEDSFPEGFSAYWIRFQSSAAATVSAQLDYQ